MVKEYEVVILGSGISGTLLAAILARHNVRVAVLDSGTHPRFAIGEATVPETTTNLKIMSRLYDVPEIGNMANFFDHRDGVGSSHGIKRGFSFCYHHDNQPHLPHETTQTATLSPPFGPDSHWFRQDTDQYMLNVAAHYGAEIHQWTTVKDFTVDYDGVTLSSDRGEFRCQFVVDASGPFSPFAKKMEIRDVPTKLTTQSRGIFTHMVGVGSWDAMVDAKAHGMPYRMDQTTLHHIFDGGWMWVIPFNNHKQATNSLCSVGVMFDCTKYPAMGTPPEEEFEAFLARYPSIGQQFKAARATRKWVSSPRIQYSSAKLATGRYFALPHAAMFIDPLFSTGLNLTVHAVNVLGDVLIQSFAQGRMQYGRLAMLENQVLHKTAVFDRLVATSFKSFRSFPLWNAWYRVWEIGTYFNTLGAMKCILKYDETGDKAHLHERFSKRYATPLAFSVEGYPELFETMVDAVEKVDRGEWDEDRGIKALYAALDHFQAMPSFITRRDPRERTIGTFTLERLIRMFIWGKTVGPASTRHYYDFGVGAFARMIASNLGSYMSRFFGVARQPFWDMFLTRTSNTPKPEAAAATSVVVRKLSVRAVEPAEPKRMTNGASPSQVSAMS